jgi:hypothetical protein
MVPLLGKNMLQNDSNITKQSPLIICMDINGTIMAEDTKEGQDFNIMIIKSLAGSVRGKWQDGYPEMSYRQMVNDVWAIKGTTQEIHAQRKQCYSSFIDRLHYAVVEGRISVDVLQQVETVYAKALAMQDYYKSNTLFPSFIAMLSKLQEDGIPFKLIYRTFGNDYVTVEQELARVLPSFTVTVYGTFKGKSLYINNQVCATFSDAIAQIPLHGAAFIQDDYQYWSKNGEKSGFGKPMPIKEGRYLLFFDDNIGVRNIINVCSDDFVPTGMCIDSQQQIQSAMAIQVDMCQAMIDDAFFINKIATYFDQVFTSSGTVAIQ